MNHDDILHNIRKEQLNQLLSGDAHMAGGGLLKAAVKAAEVAKPAVKAVQEVLPLAEREANLAKMLEGSKVKERMYHGTNKDFPSFNKNTFLTFNPEFAEHFPGGNEPEGQRILPVYVNVKNPWDYKNRSHVRRLTDELKDQGLDPDIELGIHEGDWASVEHPDVINAIKQLGHDGVFVNEIGNRNLLVFKPEKIKSAIGNRGTYDITDPDITKAGGGLLKKVMKPALKAAEAAPQAEALRLAQQRAALPPAKGGLGLAANNTPEQRAAAMGINTDAYHGTKQDIKGAFVPGYNDNLAFVTKDPDFASKWVGKGKMQKRVGAEAEQKAAEDLYRALKNKHMDFESLNLDDPNFQAEYDKRNNAFKEAFAKEVGLDPDRTHSAVYPMKVEANNTFNPETDMDVMAEYFAKNNTPQEIIKHFQHGNYLVYENQPVVDFLKSKGYDSMRLRESTDDNFPTIAVFNPETIRSRFAAFDPFRKTAATAAAMGVAAPDLMAKEQDKAQGGLIHMAGGGDPRKRGLFPKMSMQAIVDSPGFDPEVPSDLSRAYARRIAEKEAYERSMADQKLTPAQRAIAGAEASGMLGSAMFEGVQQLPKLMDGEDAYMRAVGERMYQPRFQPEKAAEYAGNVGDFLEKLETEYKMPQLLPELLPFAGAAEAAKQQAKKAVKQGALTAASRMDAGPTAGSMAAQRGVIKMPGGNFLTGRVEKDVAPLKTRTIAGETPAQRIPRHEELLKDPSLNQDQIDRVKYQLEETKKEAALDKWIDSNLSNYIKKQMGAPDDPVRALAEQGITHKASLLDEYPHDQEALMRQRKAAGFPEEGMAQSPLAKAWERASDESIPSYRAGDIQEMPEKFTKHDEAERKMIAAREELDNKFLNHIEKEIGLNDKEAASLARGMTYAEKARLVGDQDFLQTNAEYLATHDPMMSSYIALGRENPWIAKVAPETQLYSSFTGDLGFDHIIDVLKQDVAEGRIRPEQLSKVSMEQAVRRTYEYDQEMAKKMAETQAKVTEGMPVHKEYPEGYKWVELALPETPTGLPEGWKLAPNNATEKTGIIQAVSPDGVRVLGKDMPDLVKNLYRRHPDTPGNPRQQLEQALKYEGDTMGHCVGGYCPDVLEGRSRIYSLRDAKGEPHVTIETQPMRGSELGRYAADLPEGEDVAAMKNPPQRIIQIKGKQNRAPKEEYLPFVQDFVRSGNWADVGDFRNTGLIRKSDLIDKFSPDELDAIGSGEYLTKAEHDDLLLKALRPPEEGMASGGSVGLKNALNNLLRTDKPEVHMSLGGDAAKAALKAAKAAKAAYSPKVLNSTIDKFAAKIAAENPKLSEEDVLKKATRQATSKLEWERVQKPELEKIYGPLAKASYSESNPNKMQNTAEVVAERKRKANEFLDQPTEPWVPPPPELQAFDRNAIKDALEGFPGVEQTAFPRDMPTRASTSHVEEVYSDPENRALIEKQIKRGLPLGGETFYASLYPVKQAVLEAGMPAEKFDQWIYSLAPASARNSIMNEMAAGQFLRDMNARGIPLTEENVAREMALFKEKFGIGLPLMPVHRQGVQNVLEGGQNLREMNKANIPTNYKIPTYGTQKAGDFGKSVVLDVHEAAGETQGSRFHPYFKEQGGFGNTEYNAGEQGMMGIANEMGIPGGMAQAGRWFGGGELTGLRSPRGDALDLLEKQVAYTLSKKGIQPNPANVRAEVLRQIETGEGNLLPWYRKEGMPDLRQTGLQRKEGGEVTMEGGLTHCKTKKVKRHGNTVPH